MKRQTLYASKTRTQPPPITERSINTAIITQTLRKHAAQQQPRANAKSFAVSRDTTVESSCHVCYVVSQQASLLSLCCMFEQVCVTDVLTLNNVVNNIWMCKPNSAD